MSLNQNKQTNQQSTLKRCLFNKQRKARILKNIHISIWIKFCLRIQPVFTDSKQLGYSSHKTPRSPPATKQFLQLEKIWTKLHSNLL